MPVGVLRRLRPAVQSLVLTVTLLVGVVGLLAVLVPGFPGTFVDNPFAGTTALLYTALYLRMVYESEVEEVPHDLYDRRTSKEPKAWRVDKRLGRRLLGAELAVIDRLAAQRMLIRVVLGRGVGGLSVAAVLKIVIRLAILVTFISVTFGYVLFRLFRFSELAGVERSVILLTFLTFSMRWSEKLSTLYNRLVMPFSEACFQSKYSG